MNTLTEAQLRQTVAALLQAEPGFAAAFARHTAGRFDGRDGRGGHG